MAILTEAYEWLAGMLSSPIECTQNVMVAFQKIDEKIRKNILGWVVKDMDDYCRNEVQLELENLQRFVAIPLTS
jgi:hypothetical protein